MDYETLVGRGCNGVINQSQPPCAGGVDAPPKKTPFDVVVDLANRSADVLAAAESLRARLLGPSASPDDKRGVCDRTEPVTLGVINAMLSAAEDARRNLSEIRRHLEAISEVVP